MAKKKISIFDQFQAASKVVGGRIWGLETQAPRIYVWKQADPIPYSGWFEFPNADKESLGMPLFCVTIKDCYDQTKMKVEHLGETVEHFRAFEFALMVYSTSLDEEKAKKALVTSEDKIIEFSAQLKKVMVNEKL
jgi:hypothetical protein